MWWSAWVVPRGRRLVVADAGADVVGRGSASGTFDVLMACESPAAAPPDLNPMEHFFRELRRTEGRVYPTLRTKQNALEPVLEAWQADPKRVRQLCGWDWIREALPANIQVA